MVVSELKFESEPIVDENGETVSTIGNVTVSGGKGVFVYDDEIDTPSLLLETIIDSTNLGSEDDFVLTISDFSMLSSIPTSFSALLFYQAALWSTSGLLFAVGNNYEVTISAFWNGSGIGYKTFDGSAYDETDEHTLVFSRTSNVYSVSVDGTPLSVEDNILDNVELPSFVGYSLGAGLTPGLLSTNTMYIGNIKLEKGAAAHIPQPIWWIF